MATTPLQEIFDVLQPLLQQYEKGSICARVDLASRYDLYSEKDVVAFGKKRTEVYFASVIIQGSYVGFYFMPVYSDEEVMKKIIHPDLLKCLKGKSCFHIKSTNTELLQYVRQALADGYLLYKEKGWVD